MNRWIVPLVSTDFAPHAIAFAFVNAETRIEALARAVRCADAWGSEQRKKNLGSHGQDVTTSRDGNEEVGEPKPGDETAKAKMLGSRSFRAAVAMLVEEGDERWAFVTEQAPARIGLWNLGIVHRDLTL